LISGKKRLLHGVFGNCGITGQCLGQAKHRRRVTRHELPERPAVPSGRARDQLPVEC